MSATSQTVELPDQRRDDDDGDAGAIAGGTKIGRYVVLDKVGQGGMGVVYTAYDPELDRKIALKLLKPQAAADGGARLLREAQAMAKIAHPNAVAIYDVGLIGGRVFLAMELVAGVTLGDWLAVEKRSWREVVAVMLEAGRGLAAAHEVGFVHRDFKPDNVLIGPDGRPKVTDFGLARRAVVEPEPEPAVEVAHAVRLSEPRITRDSDDSITLAGAVIGTPAYMAPEQRRGAPPDLRTDQYSFGVTLYEALYGARPERHDTIVEGSDQPRSVELPAHSSSSAHVPRWLAAIVKRALSLRAEDRYPSMHALLADLARDRSAKLRRLAVVAAVPAVLLGSLAVARLFSHSDPAGACHGAEQRLAGAWDATTKLGVQRSFLATSSPFAAESWERTAAILDPYARNWVAMRQEACEATRVRGEQPVHVMSLRMLCLDRAEAQLRALTSVLASADTGIVERATQAASALPRLSECADVQLLARDHTQPTSPFDPKLARATAQVARVNALYETGRYGDGLAAAAALDRELGTDLPRIAAENAYLEGQMLFARGQIDTAIASFERSSVAAERGSYPRYVARAYGRLAFLHACPKRDYAGSERYDKHAEAVSSAIGGDALAETWRLTARACVRAAANDEKGTTAAVSRAIKVYSDAYGRDGVYATLLTTFGASLSRDPARALRAIDDAIATQHTLLGTNHPKLAFSLIVRAQQLMWLGRYDEAVEAVRRAIAIRERTVSSPDRLLSSAYLTYARILRDRGDLDEALNMAERGIGMRVASLGKDAPETIEANVVLSSILVERGKAADAIAPLEAALPKLVALVEDNPDIDSSVIDARLVLGAAYRSVGRTKEAIEQLEKALGGGHARKDPRLIAVAEYQLAQALAADPREAERARTLAADAQRGFAAIPNPAKASDVERWLSSH